MYNVFKNVLDKLFTKFGEIIKVNSYKPLVENKHIWHVGWIFYRLLNSYKL